MSDEIKELIKKKEKLQEECDTIDKKNKVQGEISKLERKIKEDQRSGIWKTYDNFCRWIARLFIQREPGSAREVIKKKRASLPPVVSFDKIDEEIKKTLRRLPE